jgi:hypothetical protein
LLKSIGLQQFWARSKTGFSYAISLRQNEELS